MITISTVLQLIRLAEGAAPVIQAIYDSAKPLLSGADQAELQKAYDAAFERAKGYHEELQGEPIKP